MEHGKQSLTGIYILIVMFILVFIGGSLGIGYFLLVQSRSIADIKTQLISEQEKINTSNNAREALQEQVNSIDVKIEDIQSNENVSPILPDAPKVKTGSEFVSIDETYNWYIDYDLGFKVKVPKFVDSKPPVSQDGKKDVPVVVKRDGNTVSITGVYDPQVLTFADANSHADVEKFIQKTYDSACSVGTFELISGSKTTYGFEVTDTSVEDESNAGFGTCFLNFAAGRFYSPGLHKVVEWPMGQDASFYVDGTPADPEMVHSFEFLK